MLVFFSVVLVATKRIVVKMAKRISPSGSLFSFSFTKTAAKKSRNRNEEEESTGTKELVDVDRVDPSIEVT